MGWSGKHNPQGLYVFQPYFWLGDIFFLREDPLYKNN